MAEAKPIHKLMESYVSRLTTFEQGGWIDGSAVSAHKLADAGFFYTRDEDEVICYHCNLLLFCWKWCDVPMVNHARWSPKCAFVAKHFRLPADQEAKTNGEVAPTVDEIIADIQAKAMRGLTRKDKLKCKIAGREIERRADGLTARYFQLKEQRAKLAKREEDLRKWDSSAKVFEGLASGVFKKVAQDHKASRLNPLHSDDADPSTTGFLLPDDNLWVLVSNVINIEKRLTNLTRQMDEVAA